MWKFVEILEDGGPWRWQGSPRYRQKCKGGDPQGTSQVAEELCLAGILVMAKQRGRALHLYLCFSSSVLQLRDFLMYLGKQM